MKCGRQGLPMVLPLAGWIRDLEKSERIIWIKGVTRAWARARAREYGEADVSESLGANVDRMTCRFGLGEIRRVRSSSV